MDNVKVASCILSNDEKASNVYQYINSHMVFDDELADFR